MFFITILLFCQSSSKVLLSYILSVDLMREEIIEFYLDILLDYTDLSRFLNLT